MKVCVMGLGIIGAATIKYVYERGSQVYGFDIVDKSESNIASFTDWNKVPKSDVYIVAVPSANVEEACKKISSQDSLVSIESTVKVGTCRRISETFNLRNLVHCPHRYWSESPIDHGVNQSRVIGGINEASLKKGLDFYSELQIPLHVCSTIEIAELCKIVENAYRFVQIAFVEELRTICDENGIPFEETRKACNTKWNIDLLEARNGIKGICLPQDIRFLRHLATSSPLIDGAISTDENYRSFIHLKDTRKHLSTKSPK